jgi:hypothetical protein
MKTPQKQKKRVKKQQKKINILSILISVLSVIFVVGGALGIYYFAKGYRLNLSERQIRRTGVVTVQSEPSSAQLYINGDSIGRTPRSRTLDIGTHNISVFKEGYLEWRKEIEILEEKSTPIYPFLVLEEPILSNIWQSDGEVKKFWENKDRDYFVFFTENSVEGSDKQYTLWSYRINTPLWNLNPNPTPILVLETENINLDISDNGQLAILHIEEEEEKNSYIIDLTKSADFNNLEPVEIISSDYNSRWSKDNRHIILESETEIVSLDSSTATNPVIDSTFTLVEKEPDTEYVWSTDEEGFFYLLEALHTPEDNTYIYALRQFQANGENPTYTIEKAYFQKNRDFINHYRENGDIYPEFTNSPQSTQTIGEIQYIEVNQTSNGVYIATDTSTYWYDISTKRYRMICAHPAQLISFSPDSRKVLFANGEYIYVFTLEKEEGDHSESIGTEKVVGITKDTVKNIGWLSDSRNIHYTQEEVLYISEKDGDNKMEVLGTINTPLYSIKSNREYVVALRVPEESPFNTIENALEINQYKIK